MVVFFLINLWNDTMGLKFYYMIIQYVYYTYRSIYYIYTYIYIYIYNIYNICIYEYIHRDGWMDGWIDGNI